MSNPRWGHGVGTQYGDVRPEETLTRSTAPTHGRARFSASISLCARNRAIARTGEEGLLPGELQRQRERAGAGVVAVR